MVTETRTLRSDNDRRKNHGEILEREVQRLQVEKKIKVETHHLIGITNDRRTIGSIR